MEGTAGGETNLAVLLRGVRPVVRDGEYVFCTLPPNVAAPAGIAPVCTFREDEGLTIVLSRDAADAAGLAYEAVFRWITLSVHSSLEAVGFLAAVATALTARGISANAIAAYYHDHLFVPAARLDDACAAVEALAGR